MLRVVLVVPDSTRNPDHQPALARLYQGGIARAFDLVGETDAWSVYRKSEVK